MKNHHNISSVQLNAARKLYDEAKILFHRKKYPAALAKVTEAIQMEPSNLLLDLLNLRALTYEQLDNQKAALADAKQMIKHEKSNPKGYLRAGRILRIMREDDIALSIYKLGLKSSEPSHPRHEELAKQHRSVLEEQASKEKLTKEKGCDPMVRLPLELIEMIMKQVPFETLVASQRVSKTWKYIISSNHPFWTVLDFSSARKPVKKQAVRSCLSKSKYKVTKAILNRIGGFDTDNIILKDLAKLCVDLEYFKLIDGSYGISLKDMMFYAKNLTTLILHCEISFSALIHLIRPETKIRRLECKNIGEYSGRVSPWPTEECKSFEEVLLKFTPTPAKDVYIGNLFQILPKLREFQVFNAQWPNDPVLDLPEYASLETFVCRNFLASFMVIKVPPTLVNLDLQDTEVPFLLDPAADTPQFGNNLKYLNIQHAPVHSRGLEFLLPPGSKLERLDAGELRGISTSELLDFLLTADRTSELKELSMQLNYDFDDYSLKRLSKFPALRRLDLSTTRVTGSGVLNFLQETKSALEELILHNCHDVSRETADHIRSKGIIVKQSLSTSKLPLTRLGTVFPTFS